MKLVVWVACILACATPLTVAQVGASNSDAAPNACSTDCTFSTCGDGIIDTGEECDDGTANSDTTPDACRTDCTVAGCGDGTTDSGEECDGGAANSDINLHACRTDCTIPVCGDGITDTGEECDDGNIDNGDGCNATCQNECGDDIQDQLEECDGGAANSDYTPDACRSDCTLPGCGDAVTDSGEACDDGASNSDTVPDACRADCTVAACGDGFTDTGEECDDGNTNDGDGCNATCQNECGDDAPEWNQIAKRTASVVRDHLQFGRSVSVSVDTVVVGAWGDDFDSGSAAVFERNVGSADAWGQVAKLTASDAAYGDRFGWSVSVSGDTVVVGASRDYDAEFDSGAAYVFERSVGGADAWGQAAKLTASDADDREYFGESVSVSGDTIVVGADEGREAGFRAGAAYVYVRNVDRADTWGQVAKLIASDAATEDYFGSSVSVSGDTVVVGARQESGPGSAYVFERNTGGADAWGQVARLTASDAGGGDRFGARVSVSGDTVVVGAYRDDDAGTSSGSAYVFERNTGGANAWGQVAKLTASDAETDDRFGLSVSISGDTVVVAAPLDDDAGSRSGSAYVFRRDTGGANTWGQVTKLTASDAAYEDYYGASVSLGGDTVVVGASGDDNAGLNSGSAYILARGCFTCGDDIQELTEECDDGTANSDTTPDACRTDCTWNTCGDAVTDSGEACDDGAGNSDIAPDACRTDCTLPTCGDGVTDTGEKCDDGNTDDGDRCNAACQNDCDMLEDETASCLEVCEDPGPAGELLSLPKDDSPGFAVAWTGHELAALTAEVHYYPFGSGGSSSTLCLQRYDSEGMFISQNCRSVDGITELLELASSGSSYLAAYSDTDTDGIPSTRVAKLNSEEIPAPEPLTIPGPGSASHAPAVLWTGHEYVLAWGDDSLWFARVDAAAENVLYSRSIATSGDSAGSIQPSVVSTGDGYMVGWKDRLLRLDPQGTVMDDSVYVAGAFGPSLVGTANGFGLAWVDNQPEAPGLYFRKLTPAGEPVGTPTRLTFSPSDDAPLVAWTGTEFGVAHEARFFRIDSAGNVIGAAHGLPYPLARPRTQGLLWTGSYYAVSVLGGEFVLSWHFSILGCSCPDSDGDGINACLDCDDANAAVYPLAPEQCDGLNNDCLSPFYPELVGTTEFDDDQDGVSECQGDCNDRSINIYPGAVEECDGFDNDCDGTVDGNCDTTCDGLDLVDSSAFPYSSYSRMVWNGVGYGFLDGSLETGEYALRYVDGAGEVLAPSLLPTEISPPGASCNRGSCPDAPLFMSWNGSEFVIGDDGLLFVTLSGDVRRVRFAPGTLPGSSVINFLQPDGNDGYLASWTRYDANRAPHHARLDADGRITSSQHAERVADWIGMIPSTTEIAVVSQVLLGDGWHTTFQRFTESWDPLGEPIDFYLGGACKDVFWTGDQYGILCYDGNLVRLDPTGIRLGEPVALGAESMVWSGSEYGAIVGDGFRRFDSAGNDLGGIEDLQGCHPEEIAWNGTEYAILGRSNDGHCFVRIGCNCFDDDGDGFSACVECDDLHPDVYPGAPQICDKYNNDCAAENWPEVRPDEADLDADGFAICEGDCDDANDSIYPAAPELCDGLANDCNAPGWPQVPAGETDGDGDGYRACENDCDDSNPRIHPAQGESCNGIDDNCNLLVDEDDSGEDTDEDGFHNLCDNCPFEFNARQADSDGDEAGDACDNCAFDYNPSQSNVDRDFEGDLCDLDDGVIYITPSAPDRIDWQDETGYSSWNLYRGDLGVLKATSTYTQVPGSSDLADRQCDLELPFTEDSIVPAEGGVAFYLVTGVARRVEDGLGLDSSGAIRPNANPCP